MPKSKVRKSIRKSQHGSRSPYNRPVCSAQPSGPVNPSPRRDIVRPQVRQVQAADFLPGDDLEELQFSQGGATWVFPKNEQVARVPSDSNAARYWQESTLATAIGAGLDDDFLGSLSDVAIEVLRESSQPVGNERFAYTEIFSEGFLDYEESPKSTLRVWLDECYLGTWEDPSYAVGPFLRDIAGTRTISEERRLEAYDRLKRFRLIVEHHLSSGRTLVALAIPISNTDRFLANQWMLFGRLPEVMTL